MTTPRFGFTNDDSQHDYGLCRNVTGYIERSSYVTDGGYISLNRRGESINAFLSREDLEGIRHVADIILGPGRAHGTFPEDITLTDPELSPGHQTIDVRRRASGEQVRFEFWDGRLFDLTQEEQAKLRDYLIASTSFNPALEKDAAIRADVTEILRSYSGTHESRVNRIIERVRRG